MTTRKARTFLVIAGLGAALVAVGCGSDSSGSGSGGSGGSSASGGASGSGGTSGSSGTAGASGAAGGDGAACVQNASAEAECKSQGAGTCAAVLDCACANCACELGACQADPGCVAIRQCAEAKNCSGTDCLGPCGDVISAHPDSTTAALGVSNCVTAHSCPVSCSDAGPGDAGTD